MRAGVHGGAGWARMARHPGETLRRAAGRNRAARTLPEADSGGDYRER